MGILKTIYLDTENNDLTVKDFNIRMTETKREYVEITVKAKFEVWLGEWYRDRGRGVPYLSEILQGNPDFNLIATIFKAEALKVAYVLDVVDYKYDYDNTSEEYTATLTLLIEGEETGTQLVDVTASAGGEL